MRALLAALLCVASLAYAASVNFAWDIDPAHPPGVTYELQANECLLTGITGTTATCNLAGSPGSPLHAQVRAVSPNPSQWTTSGWTTFDGVIPGVVLYTTPAAQIALVLGRQIRMATAPTRVTQFPIPVTPAHATGASVTSASQNVVAGEILVCGGGGGDSDSTGSLSVSGGSLVWTPQQSDTTSGYSPLVLSTATVDVDKSMTVSISKSGNPANLDIVAGYCARFSGSSGIGASNKAQNSTGNPSVQVTTQEDNSGLFVILTDWNATAGTRAIDQINGQSPTEIQALADVWLYQNIWYFPDAGAKGLKTVSVTAPSGMKWTIAVVEIKGIVGAPASLMMKGM